MDKSADDYKIEILQGLLEVSGRIKKANGRLREQMKECCGMDLKLEGKTFPRVGYRLSLFSPNEESRRLHLNLVGE